MKNFKLKNFFLVFLLSAISLSACELKKKNNSTTSSKNSNSTNKNTKDAETKKEDIVINIENSVFSNSFFYSNTGKESESSKVEPLTKIKSEIKKQATDIKSEKLAFSFSYNPYYPKIFILVGDSSQFNNFQPYQKIFISDIDGKNVKMIYSLKQNDENKENYISGFTFSSDGKSEAGWIEQDRSREDFPTRIKVVNLQELFNDSKSVSFNEFELDSDFGFFSNFLAIQEDKFIFKSDKIAGEKYGDSILNYALRTSNVLKPKPYLFIKDAIETLKIKDSSVEIGHLFSSIKSSSKNTIFFSLITNSKSETSSHIIQQDEPGNFRIIKTFKEKNFVCQPQISIRSKIPCIQLDFDSETDSSTLVQLDVSTGKILEITKDKKVSELGFNPIWWEV